MSRPVSIPAVPPLLDELAPTGRRGVRRRDLLLAAGTFVTGRFAEAAALSAPRRLKLKDANSGETFDGPYRDEAGPIPEAMADLVVLLRDHHVNKIGPTRPGGARLSRRCHGGDRSGQRAYPVRLPHAGTNAKLAKTSFGVAERSQHMYGRALDVSFDRRLGDANNVARRMKRGGVGWYPRSHFIHIDTGPTRSWELDGLGLERLLAHKPGASPAVASRMSRLHALARRQYLNRH